MADVWLDGRVGLSAADWDPLFWLLISSATCEMDTTVAPLSPVLKKLNSRNDYE